MNVYDHTVAVVQFAWLVIVDTSVQSPVDMMLM